MSDNEAEQHVEDVEISESESEEEEEVLDAQSALKAVLRTALYHDGLSRGLKEVVKSLDRNEAHLCVLSDSLDVQGYSDLVQALCNENKIPLIKVEDSKVLGEWAGLCKYNPEGGAVKIVSCSCVVIKSWGEETAAKKFIQEHIAKSK